LAGFVGGGFVAPDLSPRYRLDAYALNVEPFGRDFDIFYEPTDAADPRIFLQVVAHPTDLALDSTELTTPDGNVIHVGMGDVGYSAVWHRGDWYYVPVVLDVTTSYDDVVSAIADAVFRQRPSGG
jgi:hypothetical protein